MERTKLETIMKEKALDVIISLAPQTRLWYAKFQSSDGYLFIERKKAITFVDARYIEYVRATAQNVTVELLEKNSLQAFTNSKQNHYQTIGIESDYITIDQLNLLKKLFSSAKFVSISGQELRIVKTAAEAKLISQAAHIGLKAFEELQKDIKVGVTEKELAAKLEYLFKKHGAQKESFDTIVASGPRAAMPHAQPTDRKLQAGELVKFDFGTIYQGYMSDTTRTIKLGEIKDQKLLEIWQIVKDAQQKGIEAIKPGITSGTIDQVCRDYISKKGYGEYFIHSTGHGLGIDIHELPYVSSKNKMILKPGHVITVEPGIYIEGLGGTRFEDDILVTEDGYKILSR